MLIAWQPAISIAGLTFTFTAEPVPAGPLVTAQTGLIVLAPGASWTWTAAPGPPPPGPPCFYFLQVGSVHVLYLFDHESTVSVSCVGRFTAAIRIGTVARISCVGKFIAILAGTYSNQIQCIGRFTASLNTSGGPLRTPVSCIGTFYGIIDTSLITPSGSMTCIGQFTAKIVLPAFGARESCITGSGGTPPPIGGFNMMW